MGKEAEVVVEAPEHHPLDQVAKELSNPTVSRRRALKLMVGALVGGAGLALIPGVASAAPPQHSRAGGHVLWDATGWHHDYSPPAWRHRSSISSELPIQGTDFSQRDLGEGYTGRGESQMRPCSTAKRTAALREPSPSLR